MGGVSPWVGGFLSLSQGLGLATPQMVVQRWGKESTRARALALAYADCLPYCDMKNKWKKQAPQVETLSHLRPHKQTHFWGGYKL